jgi:nucleotide-binding universal stress UspA family protein
VIGQGKPVLLAYDGSPSSAAAIAVAGRLMPGRKALVCHVGRDAKLAGEGSELARAAGLDGEPLPQPEQRRTWRALLEAADGTGAAAVVAGAHGLSGVGRAVLGSVSTGLVHHSRVPVLVVPGTAAEEPASGPLLLCYDGSEGARRAIATAGALLDPRSALLLNVWESWVAEAPALAGASATVQGMAAELDEVADERSEDRASEGVQLAERAGFDAEAASERATGPVWQAILNAADDHACAVIVLGSRGLTGISAALGSVSNGVVHHSRRPVLVVPGEEER